MALSLLGILSAAGVGGGPSGGGAYELIESSILASDTASVTFSSIPQDFKHLQIRIAGRSNRSGATFDIANIRINSDTGTNYSRHSLEGNGSSVSSSGAASLSSISFGRVAGADTPASAFSGIVADILDYSSTTKNTTIRALAGIAQTTNPEIRLTSGAFLNTNAVTTILVFSGTSNNFITGSRFSLYGIRGE